MYKYTYEDICDWYYIYIDDGILSLVSEIF